MKVLFFVGSLAAGGLERFVTQISIKAVQQKAFIPIVVCLNKKSGIFLHKLEQNNIRVFAADPRWYCSVSGVLSLKSLVQFLDPDIVHSQVNYSIIQQFLATKLAGKSFTITERSTYARRGVSLFKRRIQYWVLKAFGVHYSANAKPVAEHLGRMLGEPSSKFYVIPNGVECHQLESIVGTRRETLGIAGHEIIIGYVARFDPPKGHGLFIEVLNILVNERGYSVRAILVGDGVLKKEIERTINSYNLTNHIIFTGVIANVEDWMPVFDILALLSNREGMPNAIIEGMAARRPVIATAVGNIPELFSNGAGFLIKEFDARKIADEFEKLINDKVLRDSVAERGYNKVKNEFSIQATLQKLMIYYNTILEQ